MTTRSPTSPAREADRRLDEHGESDAYRGLVRDYFGGDADGTLYGQ